MRTRLQWSLKLPDYNCTNHIVAFAEQGKEPDCFSGKCKIGEAIASDPDIEHIITNYLAVKRLPICSQIERVGQDLLDESGLLDHVNLLADLEGVYYQHQRAEQQKEDIKAMHKKRLKNG